MPVRLWTILLGMCAATGMLAAADLDKAWRAVEAQDEASQAALVDALKSQPDKAMAFVREQLIPRLDEKRVAELIRQLNADSYRDREEATRALVALGPKVRVLAEKALADAASLEVKTRLETVLSRLGEQTLDAGQLARVASACKALESMGSDEALSLLAELEGHLQGTASLLARAAQGSILLSRLETKRQEAIRQADQGNYEAAGATLKDMEALASKAILQTTSAAALLRQAQYDVAVAKETAGLEAALRGGAATEQQKHRLAHIRWLLQKRPQEALKLLAGGSDTARMIELSLTEKPSAAQAAELAKYLQGQAEAMDSQERARVLAQALQWAEVALKAAPDDPQVAALHQAVAVAAFSAEAEVTGWADLLAATGEPHVRAGTWTKTAGGWALKSSDFGLLELPVTPRGNYLLHVQFVRTEGKDGIYIGLPVGEDGANLNLSGWEGQASGLEWINGSEALDNVTSVKPGTVENNRLHSLMVKVTHDKDAVEVVVHLDGKQIIEWKGKDEELAAATHVWRRSNLSAFAIGAHRCDIEFRSARLKMLTGKAEQAGGK